MKTKTEVTEVTMDTTTNKAFALDARSMQIGGALLGLGGIVWLAGFAVGTWALYDAVRRWIDDMEQPPTAIARNSWSQAKVATAAGVRAWLDQQEAQQQAAAAAGMAR